MLEIWGTTFETNVLIFNVCTGFMSVLCSRLVAKSLAVHARQCEWSPYGNRTVYYAARTAHGINQYNRTMAHYRHALSLVSLPLAPSS